MNGREIMKITADLSKGTLLANGAVFSIPTKVRTLRDGTRSMKEVVLSVPDGKPYDPRPFPKGLWNITGVIWHGVKDGKENFDRKIYGPVKIVTDAWQMVNVWKLDENGNYLEETDELVKDSGYLLHYSESLTTLGCIRLYSYDDAILIGRFAQRILDQGEAALLGVI
jgi:hypothetical protein